MGLVRIIVDESELEGWVRAWEEGLSQFGTVVSDTQADMRIMQDQLASAHTLWNERHTALLRRVHALEVGAPRPPSLFRRILRWLDKYLPFK